MEDQLIMLKAEKVKIALRKEDPKITKEKVFIHKTPLIL
jgi:hypothetical protein